MASTQSVGRAGRGWLIRPEWDRRLGRDGCKGWGEHGLEGGGRDVVDQHTALLGDPNREAARGQGWGGAGNNYPQPGWLDGDSMHGGDAS